MKKPEESEESFIKYFRSLDESDVNIGFFLYSAVLAAIFGLMAAWNTVNEFAPVLANAWAWGRWAFLFCGLVEIVAISFKFHRFCLMSLPMGLFFGFVVGYALSYIVIKLLCLMIIVIYFMIFIS